MSQEATPRLPHRGRCLCGAVQYELNGEIRFASHCHCGMCRKAHGAAFGSYGGVSAGKFRITQGQEVLHEFESSPGVTRSFCSRCGSPITWTSDEHPEHVAFTLGTLEAPPAELPGMRHIHVASKAPWYDICDSVPRFEGNG
ncbi:Uncharacterized conserved protein [Variovorax sp. OV329]|nr:Uncharacterized conserved protein [Variovorax sp. OV329]